MVQQNIAAADDRENALELLLLDGAIVEFAALSSGE